MQTELVIFTRSLPLHQLGGMETIVWELARAFVRMGISVRVITTSLPDDTRDEFEIDGVRIVPIHNSRPARYSRSWWTGSRAYFEAYCLKSTAAVLSVSAAGFGVLPLKRRLKDVPFVMQAHGTSWAEVVSKWRSRRLRSIASSSANILWMPRDLHAYQKFDAVVAVGEKVRKSLQSRPAIWFTNRVPVHLIENGVDTALFHPNSESRTAVRKRLGINERVPVIISANRLHVQKGTHHCLEAMNQLAEQVPEFRYIIAGSGPEQASLSATIRRLGLADSVLLLGRLARTDLAWWMQGADAMLFLTEREEGLPLNVLEALASGIPVVTSHHAGTFESPAIQPVDPRQPTRVSKVLTEVLAKRGGGTGASLLPEKYNLTHAACQYAELLGLRTTSASFYSGKLS